MFKQKYPLKLFAIVSLAVILLTTIFVAIFGVNTSIDIGGGSQLEVKLNYIQDGTEYDGRENATEYVKEIKDVLKEHGCSVDSYFIEDKEVDTYLVVRIAKKEIKNADTISAEIAEKLSIDASRVGSVQRLYSYFNSNILLFIGLGILCLVVLSFFGGWIRYGILHGVSLVFAILHNLIISLALIFLTRVQFSMISLVSTIIFTLFGLLVLVNIFERERENKKSKQYSNNTEDQNLMIATKQCKGSIIYPIVGLVIALVMLFVPINYVRLASLSVVFSIVATLYTTTMVAPALQGFMSEIQNSRNKQKLSKNVQPKKAKKK